MAANSVSSKKFSERDPGQTLQHAYNDVDATLSVNGFLVGQIGNKVEVTIDQTTVAGDTEVFTFSDARGVLYSLKIIYTDGTREQFVSAERIT